MKYKRARMSSFIFSNLFTNIACLDGIGCENTWETECLSLTHNNNREEKHEEKGLSMTFARVRNLHLEKRSNRIHRYVIKVLLQSSILLRRLQEKNLSFLIFMLILSKKLLARVCATGGIILVSVILAEAGIYHHQSRDSHLHGNDKIS